MSDPNETALVPTIEPEAPAILQPWLSVDAVVQRVNIIREIIQKVLVRDVDYGIIPGCGDKPSLYKPGAEKIAMTFQLHPRYKVKAIRSEKAIVFSVMCKLYDNNEKFMGAGVGEASTEEDKWLWRKTSKQEWEKTPEENRRIKSYKEFNAMQVKASPASQANTVLKMSKKRAFCDAVISACCGSEFVTTYDEDSIDADAVVVDDLVEKIPKVDTKNIVLPPVKAIDAAESARLRKNARIAPKAPGPPREGVTAPDEILCPPAPKPPEKAPQERVDRLIALCDETHTNVEEIEKWAGITSMFDLSHDNCEKAITRLVDKAQEQLQNEKSPQ